MLNNPKQQNFLIILRHYVILYRKAEFSAVLPAEFTEGSSKAVE